MEDEAQIIDQDSKNMGLLSHLLTFCGYVFPFGNILGPLVIYLTKKDQSDFVRHHSAEALNFQISLTIYVIISAILVFVIIGIFFLIILAIMDIVLTIVAAIKASDGVYYRYPITIRFVN